MLWTGAEWIDPAMSIAVALLILWGSFGLLKESTWMSLAGVPAGIELEQVEAALAQLPGVETVHDLHVWPLSTTETALTAHLVAPELESTDRLLTAARNMLHDRFGIEHCTIQVERINLKDTRC
jgi:cobalt-zinc-cadmium efflux system protein